MMANSSSTTHITVKHISILPEMDKNDKARIVKLINAFSKHPIWYDDNGKFNIPSNQKEIGYYQKVEHLFKVLADDKQLYLHVALRMPDMAKFPDAKMRGMPREYERFRPDTSILVEAFYAEDGTMYIVGSDLSIKHAPGNSTTSTTTNVSNRLKASLKDVTTLYPKSARVLIHLNLNKKDSEYPVTLSTIVSPYLTYKKPKGYGIVNTNANVTLPTRTITSLGQLCMIDKGLKKKLADLHDVMMDSLLWFEDEYYDEDAPNINGDYSGDDFGKYILVEKYQLYSSPDGNLVLYAHASAPDTNTGDDHPDIDPKDRKLQNDIKLKVVAISNGKTFAERVDTKWQYESNDDDDDNNTNSSIEWDDIIENIPKGSTKFADIDLGPASHLNMHSFDSILKAIVKRPTPEQVKAAEQARKQEERKAVVTNVNDPNANAKPPSSKRGKKHADNSPRKKRQEEKLAKLGDKFKKTNKTYYDKEKKLSRIVYENGGMYFIKKIVYRQVHLNGNK